MVFNLSSPPKGGEREMIRRWRFGILVDKESRNETRIFLQYHTQKCTFRLCRNWGRRYFYSTKSLCLWLRFSLSIISYLLLLALVIQYPCPINLQLSLSLSLQNHLSLAVKYKFILMASAASIISSSSQTLFSARTGFGNNYVGPSYSNTYASCFMGAGLLEKFPKKRKSNNISRKITAAAAAAATVETSPAEEIKEFALPTWAEFDLGRAPVFWKTMNGLPPTSGERLRIFYNPMATKLVPNEEFGIAFNGGFNQPIMCGGEPRAMLKKSRGKADPPIYTIQICIPKHALNLIFSFTNGKDWDGPYRLQFQVPKPWQNKPISFFNEGLAQELSKEGACDRAIFPDSSIVINRCAMIGNLSNEGGDRCELNLVPGCIDPSSPSYNPLANVDDGSCPPYSDSEE